MTPTGAGPQPPTTVAAAGAGGRPGGEVTVGLCQWLARPGDPTANLADAAALIADAVGRGAEVVVLPELWPCGYDAATLAVDAVAAAEPIDGPRGLALAALARHHRVALYGGTVPEACDGRLFNSAVVYDRDGVRRAVHRKAHLYPLTGEDRIFTAGDRLTVVDTDEIGRVGVTVCFDGDVADVPGALARQGAATVVQPAAYEVEAEPWWDLLYPAAAVANGQWWILVNQCGTTSSGTLLGASRVIDPGGRILAEAGRVAAGGQADPEVVVCALDRRPRPAGEVAAVRALRAARRPGLYRP